jgi:hypothetical protein
MGPPSPTNKSIKQQMDISRTIVFIGIVHYIGIFKVIKLKRFGLILHFGLLFTQKS